MGAPRATRANVLAAFLALVLGFAFVVQVRQTQEAGFENLRETDLVGLLDDVSERSEQLDEEAAELERTRDELLGGSSGDQAAVEAAQERVEALAVLAGTVPVTGPGVRIHITDPDRAVTSLVLLDALQELRDAGAEAIQIGPVRVVASTYFGTSSEGYLTVDGVAISPPYHLVAVGDAHTMSGAMAIPGGFVDSVRQAGAEASVTQSESVVIDALQKPREHRYAQPVPPTSPDS